MAGVVALSLLLGWSQPVPATESSGQAQLRAALASARGGETIELADGDYGALDIVDRAFSDYVTIRSRTPRGARFDRIGIANSSYIRIDGVHVDNPGNGSPNSPLVAVTGGSRHVELRNSEVNGLVDGIYDGHFALFTGDGVSDVIFADNFLHDVKRGGVFNAATGLVVRGNTVDFIGDDSFKFIAVDGVTIEKNVGARHVFPAPGAHLDFIQFQGADSRNIVIRGNLMLPGNAAAATAQGIFLDDAHYTDVLIEKNVIVTGMIRGVSVSSGTNVVARYNTVLNVEGIGSKATKVMVDGTSYGNIESSYATDKSIGQGDNLVLQQNVPGGKWSFGEVFHNAGRGVGITLADLARVPGSRLADYGAPLPPAVRGEATR